ncbi:Uncharacterized protein SCG7086_AH_00110 [Chlamydiales bacterium SCGC AG-110-P3]|nr:Uncharacterized protein SCG7086_AH_00110 [Chlamydiales bacterium SCGC AG-110-P3]
MGAILTTADNLQAFSTAGGSKAMNLARLEMLGITVPPWICLGTSAFQEYVTHYNLKDRLCISHDLAATASNIEQLFLSLPLPRDLIEEIDTALRHYNLIDRYVAVRSSGLEEDSIGTSFAGQFSSYLYQHGTEAISESIRRCWASGYSERGLSYRQQHGLPVDDIQVAVIIQSVVDAESAGIAFSRDPVQPLDGQRVVISSVWGLSEGLVSGEFAADTFIVQRQGNEIASNIMAKPSTLTQNPQGGTHSVELSKEKMNEPSLTKAQVRQIADLAILLERALELPQDCEWAFADETLYCLQTRPITNLPPSAYYSAKINGNQTTLWDNSNIIESYSGVTTPLTFTFTSHVYHQVYLQTLELLGVPEEVITSNRATIRNMLGLIRGRIYYNLINQYKFLSLLPEVSSNAEFMDTMIGVEQTLDPQVSGLFDFVAEPHKYSFRHKMWLGWTLFQKFRNIDKIATDFQQHFNRAYQDIRSKDFEKLSLPEQGNLYDYIVEEVLENWKAPIINDIYCMVFFGQLKKLTQKWLGDTTGAIQSDLLSGQGGIASAEPTKMLMRIAATIDNGDPNFKDWILNTDPEHVWPELIESEAADEFKIIFEDYLDKYGFRCINELKLEDQDLHDNPAFAINAIVSYVRTGCYSTESMEARERSILAKSERMVADKLKGWRLKIFRWVLAHSRKAIRYRDALRFDRTKIFGVVRHLIQAIGNNLESLGFIDDSSDVFYLTIDEITQFIEGRSATLQLRELITMRRREFVLYRSTPAPPDRFLTKGTTSIAIPYPQLLSDGDLLRNNQESAGSNVLLGTPCCPGVVEGTVRVVHSVDDAKGIDGEILVTEKTDPGWVPLYPSCSGLLIERGSLLSHSAVVARELGLPTIVGISGGLMKKLKTGQQIRFDAGKGEIYLSTDGDSEPS